MNYDSLLLLMDKLVVKSYEESLNLPPSISHALNSASIGSFRWDIESNEMHITHLVYDICGMDYDFSGSFLEMIQLLFDATTQFNLVSKINNVLSDMSSEHFEGIIYSAQKKELRWIKITSEIYVENNQKYLIGMIQDIHDLKIATKQSNELNEQLYSVLRSVPMPLFYYDQDGQIVYLNENLHENYIFLNKLTEKFSTKSRIQESELENIQSIECISADQNHQKYKIVFSLNQEWKVYYIHRILIQYNFEEIGKLYIHEDITAQYNNENHMKKILKVHEVIIEIKDIVDKVRNLQGLYDFILPKINLVIPSVKRACVLILDHDKNMYMSANYGYDLEYQKKLKLPFFSSYANLCLNGNYSKSIIINDVQKKFADLYPELNRDQNGFILASNMVAPLIIEGHLYGLLSVDSNENNIFDEVDLNLIDYIKLQLERSILQFREISKVKRNAIVDELTGIYNRRHLISVFDDYIQQANLYDKDFAFVLMDLDDLKGVNDTYGHLAGDKMIKQFAYISNNEIRDVDFLARYGGDEFIVIFWDISKEILTTKMAYWQELMVTHPIWYEGNKISTFFSYGIAYFREDGLIFDELLKKADHQMYLQKVEKK